MRAGFRRVVTAPVSQIATGIDECEQSAQRAEKNRLAAERPASFVRPGETQYALMRSRRDSWEEVWRSKAYWRVDAI